MNDANAAEVAKALSHPLRIELVRAMRDERVLSPGGYSRESGEPLGNVSYHVKALLEAEVITTAELVPRRGAVEHFYSLNGRRAKAALGLLDRMARECRAPAPRRLAWLNPACRLQLRTALQKRQRLDLQLLGDSLEFDQREVPLAPLGSAHVGPVDAQHLGEGLLAQPARLAVGTKIVADVALQIALHEGKDGPAPLLDSLHTYK